MLNSRIFLIALLVGWAVPLAAWDCDGADAQASGYNEFDYMLERGDHSMNALFPVASQNFDESLDYGDFSMKDIFHSASRNRDQQPQPGDFTIDDFFPEDSQASASEEEEGVHLPLQSRAKRSGKATEKIQCSRCTGTFMAS
jgi:hypothetical protein